MTVKRARDEALKKDTEASPPKALDASSPAQQATSTTQTPNPASETTISFQPIKVIASTREPLQAPPSLHRVKSGRVVPIASILDSFHSHDTFGLLKGFAKEHHKIGLNHHSREIELASYHQDLVPQRRLLLFLAYAMASVFTALALWMNFAFAVRFDATAQYDWVYVTSFSMIFDLVVFSVIRILMIWTFPKTTIVIALFVFMVGTFLFATFCGDDITEDGSLVVLTCTTSRV